MLDIEIKESLKRHWIKINLLYFIANSISIFLLRLVSIALSGEELGVEGFSEFSRNKKLS